MKTPAKLPFILSNDNMIIIYPSQKINTLNQSIYNSIVNSMDFSSIVCPDCSAHEWYYHAYYPRYYDFFGHLKLRVLRVKCKNCGKTHTVLVFSLIPFSSLNYHDIISIVFDNDPVYSSLYYFLRDKYSSLPKDYFLFCKLNAKNLRLIFFST